MVNWDKCINCSTSHSSSVACCFIYTNTLTNEQNTFSWPFSSVQILWNYELLLMIKRIVDMNYHIIAQGLHLEFLNKNIIILISIARVVPVGTARLIIITVAKFGSIDGCCLDTKRGVVKNRNKWLKFASSVCLCLFCSIESGGRFKETYELLNLRALKNSPVNKIHIFQCMSKIFCVEFQRYPLKLHTKYLTHTLKDTIFIQHWNFKSS